MIFMLEPPSCDLRQRQMILILDDNRSSGDRQDMMSTSDAVPLNPGSDRYQDVTFQKGRPLRFISISKKILQPGMTPETVILLGV